MAYLHILWECISKAALERKYGARNRFVSKKASVTCGSHSHPSTPDCIYSRAFEEPAAESDKSAAENDEWETHWAAPESEIRCFSTMLDWLLDMERVVTTEQMYEYIYYSSNYTYYLNSIWNPLLLLEHQVFYFEEHY